MNTKSFRIIGGPLQNPPTTDFLDTEVIVTLNSSGAAGTNANVLFQGNPICADVTSRVTTDATTPVIEQAVLPLNASAGNALGVYQGATLTNALTTGQSSIATLVRKQGYGLVRAGGVTTSVTVNGVLSILPSSTPTYASQLTPAFGATAQGTTYYVGVACASGSVNTIGGILVNASTTTQALVNAFINVLG